MFRFATILVFSSFTVSNVYSQPNLIQIQESWSTIRYSEKQLAAGIEVKSSQNFQTGNKQIEIHSSIRIKNSNVLSNSVQIENGNTYENTCCKNELYSFRTSKKNGLQLLDSTTISSGGRKVQWAKGCSDAEFSLAEMQLTIAGYYLPTLVKMQGVKIEFAIDKGNLIKMHIKNPHPVKEVLGKFEPLQAAVFWLDPLQNYIPIRCEIDKAFASRSFKVTSQIRRIDTGTIEYDTVESQTNASSTALAVTNTQTAKIALVYDVNMSDREFTLSAFGLPEPLGITPLSRKSHMMYLYIAIPVLAAIGLLSAYIRRRYYPRAVVLPPTGTAGS